MIQQTVGENVKLVDSGEATAEEVEQLLADKGLANPNAVAGKRELCDDLDHFYVTDAADDLPASPNDFSELKPSKLEAIEVYGVDELKKR